jgi:hypothetical protein
VVTVEDVYLPPPGLLLLIENEAIPVGPYTATLRGFHMDMHGDEDETVAAGAVIEFAGPEGITVLTPTQIVGPAGIETPPVTLVEGISVELVQLAVEERAAWVQIEGLDLPRQIGVAWLQVQGAGSSAGLARVHVSVKPGMNLLWAGGVLLLLGTILAIVRRWRESKTSS